MQAVSFWDESKIGMRYHHLLDFILDHSKHTVRKHILFSQYAAYFFVYLLFYLSILLKEFETQPRLKQF